MSPTGTTLTSLVGREPELRAIESRLANGARIVTLLGPGGSGKTRLARELLDRRRAQGNQTYFVDLVGIHDQSLVPSEIATELGVSESEDLEVADAVVSFLRDEAAVVILDNLEELTESRDFVARVLHAAAGLQVLATSRIPLGIDGEVEFQVPPLGLPHGDGAAEVESSPAGRLFLERTRAIGRLDVLDAPTAKAIADLCRRLDGLPLALELAAARTRILPPAAILRHLSEHTPGLLTKDRKGDARHESLDAVLSWSIDLLQRNETETLAAVAICAGGFDFAMAQALAPDRNVLQALDVLAIHGLLSSRGDLDGEPWYRLLETIRAAIIDRAPGDATDSPWRMLATHLSGRVEGTLEAYHRIDDLAFRRLDLLLDDVRAVLDWTELNDPRLNLSIAAEFCWYWQMRGQSREGITRLRAAIAANPEASSDLARAYYGLARLERFGGGEIERRRAATEAARIGRVVGDPEREVDGLAEIVISADAAIPEASNRLRELLPAVSQPASRYQCLAALAVAEGLESGVTEAVFQLYRDAEAALSGTPYVRLQGMSAANMAQSYLYADRPIDAYAQATRALSILGEVGPETAAWLHSLRAIAASGTGQVSDATESLRLALDLADPAGIGLLAEVMIAAVAVLAASDTPLLAAKAWGATMAGGFSFRLVEADRSLAERRLVAARRATDPVAFEVAFKAGQKVGLARMIEEVVAHLDGIEESPSQGIVARLRHGTLTQRELEVLALVGAGKSNGDIAAELFISTKTASVHIANAKAKLGVATRLEAALWARDRGLASDDASASFDS